MKFLALGNHLTPILLAISAVLGGTLALESSNLVRPEDDRPSKNPAAVEPVPQPNSSTCISGCKRARVRTSFS